MAKPNYSFEKRQRELKKKKKQEQKRARKHGPTDGAPGEPSRENADSAPGPR